MEKKTILMAHFGTSHPESLEKVILVLEKDVQAAYPGWDVRTAFTSETILALLKKRGEPLPSVPEALKTLSDAGIGEVVVQPTFLIQGGEYRRLLRNIKVCRERFAALSLGRPLLAAKKDREALCRFLARCFPLGHREALVLMGHGSAGPEHSAYVHMSQLFGEMGFEQIFVGIMKGHAGIQEIRRQLARKQVSRVILAPLMLTAGSHALKEMAGEGAESWKSQLEADGYQVTPILRGLGEYPEVRNLYLSHIGEASPVE